MGFGFDPPPPRIRKVKISVVFTQDILSIRGTKRTRDRNNCEKSPLHLLGATKVSIFPCPLAFYIAAPGAVDIVARYDGRWGTLAEGQLSKINKHEKDRKR